MKKFSTFVFATGILALNFCGAAMATTTDPAMPMNSDMTTMRRDPAGMCSMMMQNMMKDPEMHRKMNEMMRRYMGNTSQMRHDPAKAYSMMMQSMMNDPAMHRQMNEMMTRHRGGNSMKMNMDGSSMNMDNRGADMPKP